VPRVAFRPGRRDPPRSRSTPFGEARHPGIGATRSRRHMHLTREEGRFPHGAADCRRPHRKRVDGEGTTRVRATPRASPNRHRGTGELGRFPDVDDTRRQDDPSNPPLLPHRRARRPGATQANGHGTQVPPSVPQPHQGRSAMTKWIREAPSSRHRPGRVPRSRPNRWRQPPAGSSEVRPLHRFDGVRPAQAGIAEVPPARLRPGFVRPPLSPPRCAPARAPLHPALVPKAGQLLSHREGLPTTPTGRRARSVPVRPVNHGQQRCGPACPGATPGYIHPGQKLSGSPSAVASQGKSASSILVTRSMMKPQASGLRFTCCHTDVCRRPAVSRRSPQDHVIHQTCALPSRRRRGAPRPHCGTMQDSARP